MHWDSYNKELSNKYSYLFHTVMQQEIHTDQVMDYTKPLEYLKINTD